MIELLVVIAIIGVLASVVLASLNVARAKSRDAVRLVNMSEIYKALITYYIDNSSWPAINGDSCNDGWDVGPCAGDPTFIQSLETGGYFSKVPVDPIGSADMHYRYYVYNAGNYGCPASRGKFFVLGVNDMEGSPQPHPNSPGWSCPTRNWQPEFDWVIGGFEH